MCTNVCSENCPTSVMTLADSEVCVFDGVLLVVIMIGVQNVAVSVHSSPNAASHECFPRPRPTLPGELGSMLKIPMGRVAHLDASLAHLLFFLPRRCPSTDCRSPLSGILPSTPSEVVLSHAMAGSSFPFPFPFETDLEAGAKFCFSGALLRSLHAGSQLSFFSSSDSACCQLGWVPHITPSLFLRTTGWTTLLPRCCSRCQSSAALLSLAVPPCCVNMISTDITCNVMSVPRTVAFWYV